jgi:hypothetical protein
MALTSFSLAAIPVKLVAVPVLVGFAAGTGAFAAYVTGPTPAVSASAQMTVAALPAASLAPAPVVTEQVTPAKPAAKPSCEQQAWPYLDNRCIARGNAPERKVRVVMAPRNGDETPRAAAPDLVSSDTVLRGQGVAPEAEQPAAKKATKRSEKRQRGGNEFRRAYSVYSVPSARGAQPVIVVRPLRLNAYSSRF